mmetsp:Transcript_34062/g.104609  ORF Transcript_34062/g.104609 Transcript_34062/m.104609 type:complete len:147 (-) Transcript_34062:648-1088(-)
MANGGGDFVVIQQEYSVGFESATNVARSNKMANVINRTKSGNPGYIFGRPVLLGSSRSTTIGLSVISPKAQGLELLGSVADGVCAASRGHTVNFGVNVQSGCLLKLNRSELRDFCVGRGPHVAGNGVPHLTATAFSLVRPFISRVY